MKKQLEISTGWLNVNTECNNRCVWCYRTDDINNAQQRMGFGVASQLVDFFVN